MHSPCHPSCFPQALLDMARHGQNTSNAFPIGHREEGKGGDIPPGRARLGSLTRRAGRAIDAQNCADRVYRSNRQEHRLSMRCQNSREHGRAGRTGHGMAWHGQMALSCHPSHLPYQFCRLHELILSSGKCHPGTIPTHDMTVLLQIPGLLFSALLLLP